MPVDKFDNPFFHASKVNGFFYQMSSNPANDQAVDWPDEMTFSGSVATMHPDGPTDFGIGPHARSGPEGIGGCDLDFEDTLARGYMYKTDDTRDIEYKCFVTFNNITEGEGFSISANTARHTDPKPCCQGNAYMANLDPNADPDDGEQFRFRKEMWHVSYHTSPEGWFTDDRINFVIADHGKIGFGFCRYNDPDDDETVVCEMWINPTPDSDKDNWFMIKQVRDTYGNGWGDDGGDCGGADDQPLLWGGPQSRCKTNSSGGSVKFEAITLREIDPSRDFDDPPPPPPPCPSGQVWDGTKCVPTSGGGGGGPPPPTPGGGGTVNPIITYCAASSFSTTGFPTISTFVPVSNTTLVLSEEIPECMINPDRFKRFGNQGWVRDSTTLEGADIGDRPCDFGVSLANIKTYPSGLVVETYWSESDQVCVCPGVGNGTAGGPSGQDTQLLIAVIRSDEADRDDPWEWVTATVVHEIVESMTDPITSGDLIDHEAGWINSNSSELADGLSEISDICEDEFQFGGSSGVWMQGYWSNSVDKCIAPVTGSGVAAHNPVPPGAHNFVYGGGRLLTDAKVYLIFWGSTWKTRTSSPNASQLVHLVKDLMLGSQVDYFDELTEYNITNRPTWGGHVFNDITPIPSASFPGDGPIDQCVIDCFEKGLLPRPAAVNQNIYMVILPDNKTLPGALGWHYDMVVDNLSSPSGNATVTHEALQDNNGINWLEATGPIVSFPNSRDDPDDFRWSKGVDGMETIGKGYETTYFVKCNNIDLGDGHTAMKLGGPNHSGDCGGSNYKEDGTCCCWYDLGIRSNGDIQTQIERPHPDNFDWACDECTMDNIGVTMEDHWIGIKHILYPLKPGGSADNGGIKLKMYVSVDAIVSGVPTNDWELVFDITDNKDRDILTDYPWPLGQEIEMRLSGVQDLDDVQVYKNAVFVRAMTDDDTTGGGGGGGNTDGIYNHGGRMMHNPKIQVIFWGADWNVRAVNPTKAQVIDHLQNKLLGTNITFFSKLSQYGAPGNPTWLTPVVNTTVIYPTNGLATVAKLQEVIEQSLESGVCPIPADFLNTIFVVLPEVDKNISVPTTDVGGSTTRTDYRYRDCFKPVITLPGGAGGGGGSGSPQTVQGVFKFMRDINVLRVSACAGSGSEIPPPPGSGGGGTTAVFYTVTDVDAEKELSDSSAKSNRTRIAMKVASSGSVYNGKIIKEADVALRKEGSPGATPVVNFKIWDNAWNVVYTSPTTFAPNALSGTFGVWSSGGFSVFDCSTNTHALVVGDRVGVEWTGTSSSNYVVTGYETPAGSSSYQIYREGSSNDEQTGRKSTMVLWA